MPNLIFSSSTQRGTGFNRLPVDGEFVAKVENYAWFFLYPERYQYINGVFSEVQTWASGQEAATAAAAVEAQKKTISAQRYALETAGVTYGNHIIDTDRESQQILDSAIEKIRRGLIPAITWKTRNGWIVLDVTNIAEIEILILSLVQGAFAWEKAEIEKLEV